MGAEIPVWIAALIALLVGSCAFVLAAGLTAEERTAPSVHVETEYSDLHRHVHTVLGIPEPPIEES